MDKEEDGDGGVSKSQGSQAGVHIRGSVRIGCGAGFGGDRPAAALKLLKSVPGLDYLVLECLAERTLAVRYQAMQTGQPGYDPRIKEWMRLLLPTAVEKRVTIITNMGVADPLEAQKAVLAVASELGLSVTVAVAYETALARGRAGPIEAMGASTYLGAAPIVEALSNYDPDVVITSRVADAALFLAPMVHELGWAWDRFDLLAAGTVAGHLLECGCQLTGGYYANPADDRRSLSLQSLLSASMPYADVSRDGRVHVAKAHGSGGELSPATCTQQLVYEIGDPAGYITPDVVVDMRHVIFRALGPDRVAVEGAHVASPDWSGGLNGCQTGPRPIDLLQLTPEFGGWKGWGEISYGGLGCEERADLADGMVRAWMEERYPESGPCILSSVIGRDSLWPTPGGSGQLTEARLRLDGLFEGEAQARALSAEVEALYTNGPAGGGGVRTGCSSEIILHRSLVPRDEVTWSTSAETSSTDPKSTQPTSHQPRAAPGPSTHDAFFDAESCHLSGWSPPQTANPAPAGTPIPLHKVAHGRAGDKGNRSNISLVPFCPDDFPRLCAAITPDWVHQALFPLASANASLPTFLATSPSNIAPMEVEDEKATPGVAGTRREKEGSPSPFGRGPTPPPLMKDPTPHIQVQVYQLPGPRALNIDVDGILDGGITVSRRLDRHGKTLADLLLGHEVTLCDAM